MDVISHTSRAKTFAAGIACDNGKIGVKRGSHQLIQDRRSVFGAKDDMHENTGERLRHDGARINRGYISGSLRWLAVFSQIDGVWDGSGFQPLLPCRFIPRPLPNLLLRRKSGVGLGWYSVAPSALGLVESHTRAAAAVRRVLPPSSAER
jgi:hypothetical protein